MDENLAYWSASFQRAGKWFSSSLALGIDVVADISDRLPFDTPCYHDRAKCRPPSYFQPTWWAHNPQAQVRDFYRKRDFGKYPRSLFIKWYQSRERIPARRKKNASRRGKRYNYVKVGEFMVLPLCRWRQRKVRRFAAT